jgi:flagellar motor switch protein FliM
MMRQKFDQQWSVRKTQASAAEQERILRVIRRASLTVEGRLEGPRLRVEDLLKLDEGHLLTLDCPVGHTIELQLNGQARFDGRIVLSGRKRAFVIDQVRPAPNQGIIKPEGSPAAGSTKPAAAP